jgi:hypothetical protein
VFVVPFTFHLFVEISVLVRVPLNVIKELEVRTLVKNEVTLLFVMMEMLVLDEDSTEKPWNAYPSNSLIVTPLIHDSLPFVVTPGTVSPGWMRRVVCAWRALPTMVRMSAVMRGSVFMAPQFLMQDNASRQATKCAKTER